MTQRFKETAFMIGFLIYILILYVNGSKLSADSLLFPKVIISISVIAVGLKLLTLRFPRLKFLDPSGNVAKDVLHIAEECGGIGTENPSKMESEKSGSRAVAIALFMLWLITFAAGVYYIGFLPTMAVWLFFFMAGISKIKVVKALMLSISTFAVLYVVFVMLLSTHFPRGILF
jgi:hypothetical protein